MHPQSFLRRSLVLGFASLALASYGTLHAKSYTFTRIADTSGPFSAFSAGTPDSGLPSINADGYVAYFATLAIAFVGGLLPERIIIRPVENAPVLTIVIVCIGLLVILNSVAGWVYSAESNTLPPPSSGSGSPCSDSYALSRIDGAYSGDGGKGRVKGDLPLPNPLPR